MGVSSGDGTDDSEPPCICVNLLGTGGAGGFFRGLGAAGGGGFFAAGAFGACASRTNSLMNSRFSAITPRSIPCSSS